MNTHKIKILADIYLYSDRDAELITLIDTLLRHIKAPLFIGMAELARRNEWIDIEDLYSPKEGDELKNAKIIRLNIEYKKYPALVKLWEKLPRGTKSVCFVALIKSTLREWKGKVPPDFLLDSSAMSPTSKEAEKEKSLVSTKKTIADTLMASLISPLDITDEDEDET